MNIGYHVGLISYTEDVDFTNVSGILLFEGSHGAGACLPVTVTVIKDELLESDEIFQLSASVSTSRAIFFPGGDITTILIQDDDGCKQPYIQRNNNCICFMHTLFTNAYIILTLILYF